MSDNKEYSQIKLKNKSSIRYSFYLLAAAFISFLIITCTEKPPTENNEEVAGELSKTMCTKRTELVWELDRYEPVSGKTLGFNENSFASNKTMRTHWGFTSVKTSNPDAAMAAGFSRYDIMINVKIKNPTSAGSSFDFAEYPKVIFNKYYIDEPLDKPMSHLKRFINYKALIDVADYVYPKSLYISSYKIGELNWIGTDVVKLYKQLISIAPNLVLMSDNYYGFSAIESCKDDQTGLWEDFKDEYGFRNRANWISLLIDGKQNDFAWLLKKAGHMRFKELWLYIGNAGDDNCGGGERLTKTKFNDYIYSFTYAAWKRGWLKRIDKLVRYEYTCNSSDACNECEQDNLGTNWKPGFLGSGWDLQSRTETSSTEAWNSSHEQSFVF